MNENEGRNLESTSANEFERNEYSSHDVKGRKKGPNKLVIILIVAIVFAAVSFFIVKNRDTDVDGLTDFEERLASTNKNSSDTDGDTLTDYHELEELKTDPKMKDTDEDGISDDMEVNEFDSDPQNEDTDGDGLIDGDELDVYDTLISVKDSDEDGLEDGAEVNEYGTDPRLYDTDSDSLMDGEEVNDYGTDPLAEDTDGDGMSDSYEVTNEGLDPLKEDEYVEGSGGVYSAEHYEELYSSEESSGVKDSDGDNLNDDEEILFYETDPYKADTDGDGVNDGVEIMEGTGDDESFYLDNGTYTVTTTADVCEIEYGIYDRYEYVVRSGESVQITIDGSNDIFETVWYTLPVGETVTFTPVLD